MDEYGDHYATTYEPDDEVIESRLRHLYPHVPKGTSLPQYWNRQDKMHPLHLSHMNLRIHYPERDMPEERKNSKDAASVRANCPIPLFCGIYYFEVHIIHSDGYMGVGVCEKNVAMGRLPGWDRGSYGYHGDDGNFFSASGQGTNYGPKYHSGDVIGCGVNLIKRTIFFTKNGQNLENARTTVTEVKELYPTVGLQTPQGVVDVNFGQKPFVYDIYGDIQKLRSDITRSVSEIHLPTSKTTWLNNCIASWLAVEGYSKTLAVFSREAQTPMEEDESSVESRKEVARLIMSKRSLDAYALIEKNYPNLLLVYRSLELDLRSQKFVELAASMASPGGPCHHYAYTNGNSRIPPCGHDSSFSTGASPRGTNPLKRRSSTSIEESAIATLVDAGDPTRSLEGGDQQRPSSLREPSTNRGLRRSGRRADTGFDVPNVTRSASLCGLHFSSYTPLPRTESSRMEVDGEEGQTQSGRAAPATASSSGSASTDLTPSSPSSALSMLPQALSSKNGTSANGKAAMRSSVIAESATVIVEEDSMDGMLPESDEVEDMKMRCGYTRQEKSEYEKFEPLLSDGEKIYEMVRIMEKSGSHDENLVKAVRLALTVPMLKYESDFVGHELLSDNRLRCLAKHAHTRILEYLNKSAESKLVKLERLARQDKVSLSHSEHPAAPFIDFDHLILGRPKEQPAMREKGAKAAGEAALANLHSNIRKRHSKIGRRDTPREEEAYDEEEDEDLFETGDEDDEDEEEIEEDVSDEEDDVMRVDDPRPARRHP